MQILNRRLRVRQKHVFIDYKIPFLKVMPILYKLDFSRWFTIVNVRLLHEMLPRTLYIM